MAAMHIPSALLDFENDILQATIRFFEAGLAGFALGYIYWRTRSVVTTIAVHGLNNFAVSGILPLLTGISAPQVLFKQSAFQLAWLIGQVGVTIFIAKALFKSSEQFDTEA
jgi:membrane protease YdiL (CAAX protease family)